MAATLLRAVLLLGSLLLALVGPAAGEPSQDTHAFMIAVSAPCAHDTADHAPVAACPPGMAACWNHCPQVPQATFVPAPWGAVFRPPFIRDIAGRDQAGPTRHLPPPKLFS